MYPFFDDFDGHMTLSHSFLYLLNRRHVNEVRVTSVMPFDSRINRLSYRLAIFFFFSFSTAYNTV